MFFFQAKPAALARNPFAEQPNPFQVGLNFHVNNECMIYNSTLSAFDFLLSIEMNLLNSCKARCTMRSELIRYLSPLKLLKIEHKETS